MQPYEWEPVCIASAVTKSRLSHVFFGQRNLAAGLLPLPLGGEGWGEGDGNGMTAALT